MDDLFTAMSNIVSVVELIMLSIMFSVDHEFSKKNSLQSVFAFAIHHLILIYIVWELSVVVCREITEKDILYPEVGRSVAAKIGASYYETSVLDRFGIEDLFTNVLRAALVGKRNRHFWMALSSLKSVHYPLLQAPYCVPKPKPPIAIHERIDECVDFSSLLDHSDFSDIAFHVNGVTFDGHAACLATGSDIFNDLLGIACLGLEESNSIRCLRDVAVEEVIDEVRSYVDVDCCSWSIIKLNHAIFRFIVRRTFGTKTSSSLQPIVIVNKSVSPTLFRSLLYYVYTGRVVSNMPSDFYTDFHHIAEILKMNDLTAMVANYVDSEDYLNLEILRTFVEERRHRMRSMLLDSETFPGKKYCQ